MNRRIRPVVMFFAGVVIGAAYLATRLNDQSVDSRTLPSERSVAGGLETDTASSEAPRDSAPGAQRQNHRREDVIAELENASQSYRDTTLLVAIHDFSFICESVTEVMPIGEAPDKGWHVECTRGLAYAISVDANGVLLATPAPSSVDGYREPVLVPQPSPIPR